MFPNPEPARPKLKYAGIGSRVTPDDILRSMEMIGMQLGSSWTLRSGYAGGADLAFWRGAHMMGDAYEMYLPWSGFNGAPTMHECFIVPDLDASWWEMAAKYHPNWNACSAGAKKLHARNIAQVLGRHGPHKPDPVDMVVCWTPQGKAGGGTGQAIRIALDHKIPVFDLAIEANKEALISFVAAKEAGMP